MDYELLMNGNIKLGQKAPDFTANSTFGKINLSDYSGKWLVFFSHPGDFTPVCTTEMIAFARAYPFFQKLNTNLLGLSIDSNASHLAWVNEIYNLTGVSLPFPIIADRNGSIARLYGMISNDVSTTKTVRNVFISVILTYPLNIGRFIPEIIRTVEALQISDCADASTPANWQPGVPVIISPPQTFSELQQRLEDIKKNCNGISWYLSFKEPSQKCLNDINIEKNC